MKPEEREQEWAEGFHTSSSGKRTPIAELPTPYLTNIVNKYGIDHDVTPIQEVIDSRPAEEQK